MSNYLQRIIGGMLPQANTSPIMYDDWGNLIDPTAIDAETPPVVPPPPAPRRNVGGIIGGMLNGAIDAGATPNVALGGPTDMFRAMQAAQQGGMAREDRNFNRSRQAQMDAESRSTRNAQAQENLAQADYWKKRTELEANDRKYQQAQPKARETYFNSTTGRRHYNDTDEPVNPKAPGKPAPPMVNVGVGQPGEEEKYGPGFMLGDTPMPSFGKAVPMAPGDAASFENSMTARRKLSVPQMGKPTAAQLEQINITRKNELQAKLERTPEEEAELANLNDVLSMREAKKDALKAGVIYTGVGTGQRAADTGLTQTKGDAAKYKLQAEKDADHAQATSPSLDDAINNINNPSFYTHLDGQQRAAAQSVLRERKLNEQKALGKRRADKFIKTVPLPNAASPAPGQPKTAPPQSVVKKVAENQTATAPDGTVWIKKNGEMVPLGIENA